MSVESINPLHISVNIIRFWISYLSHKELLVTDFFFFFLLFLCFCLFVRWSWSCFLLFSGLALAKAFFGVNGFHIYFFGLYFDFDFDFYLLYVLVLIHMLKYLTISINQSNQTKLSNREPSNRNYESLLHLFTSFLSPFCQ